jgi:hypothetical protein
VAVGALFAIIEGILGLIDMGGDARPRSVAFLVLAGVAVLAIGLAFWRGMTVLVAGIGNWMVPLVLVWGLYALYLIVATIASIPGRKSCPSSKSRPAS